MFQRISYEVRNLWRAGLISCEVMKEASQSTVDINVQSGIVIQGLYRLMQSAHLSFCQRMSAFH